MTSFWLKLQPTKTSPSAQGTQKLESTTQVNNYTGLKIGYHHTPSPRKSSRIYFFCKAFVWCQQPLQNYNIAYADLNNSCIPGTAISKEYIPTAQHLSPKHHSSWNTKLSQCWDLGFWKYHTVAEMIHCILEQVLLTSSSTWVYPNGFGF